MPGLAPYVLAAALAGVGALLFVAAEPAGGSPTPATTALGDVDARGAAYRYANVERGDVLASVAATGTLAPVASVLVGSEVSGQIKAIHADFNTEVRRGEAIALIDPVSFEIAVEQAQADLDVARAVVATQQATIARLAAAIETARFELQAARAGAEAARINVQSAAADLKRRQSAAQIGSTADRERAEFAHQSALAQLRSAQALEGARQSMLAAAEADVQAARAQLTNYEAVVRQREAALRHARIELERTVIRAPVDGVVIHRNVEAGQTVAASLQAPTLFTIAQDLRDMQVNASIDESEIGRIVPGQRVEFVVDAHHGRRFSGTADQIRKSPQVSQNVVTYTVVVKAPNPDLLLLPGMTASARFITGERNDVVKVPNAALRFRPAGVAATPGRSQVWVEADGRLHAVAVEAGLNDGSHTEVSGAGLEPGMRVAIGVEPVRRAPSAGSRLLGGFGS